MDPPKEHHQRMHRLEHVFAEMKQDPTATPQVMSKTAQKFESDISKSILQPRTADALVKMPDDDDDEQG
jgi:hypothetical protein